MSRIGKKPILIHSGVTVSVTGNTVKVKGPLGELSFEAHPAMSVKVENNIMNIVPARRIKNSSKLWGTTRAIIANMVEGVTNGFSKKLEIDGVGYKVELSGNDLLFSIGFSHPVKFEAVKGIQFKVEKNIITVSGVSKEIVGNTASSIRALKKPEPYKGKGIHYVGEVIRRKAGKKATASA